MTDKEKLLAIQADIGSLKDVEPNDYLCPSSKDKIQWLSGKMFALVKLEVLIDSQPEEDRD